MKYLLDTNVVGEATAKHPEAAVQPATGRSREFSRNCFIE